MKSKTKFLSFLIVLSLVLFGCSKITSDIVNSTKDITNIENTNKPEETLKPGYVKIKLGIGNNVIARTIMPAPEDTYLYFTVFASTATENTSVAGFTLADYSSTAAAVNGYDCITPIIPSDTNVMTGIELIVAAEKQYIISVIGTKEFPSTLYAVSATDEQKIDAIKAAAVVAGSLPLWVEPTGDAYTYYDKDPSLGSDEVDYNGVLKVQTQTISDASERGSVLIPFEVPALTGEYAKYPVEKVILKLTGTSGNALSNDVQVEESVTAGENVKHAFKLSAVPSGNYDVDLIYTDSSDNEQFHLYDTLIVWSKFESVLVGSSAYYDDVSYTQGIDDSGSPVAASGTKKGFKVTADDIKDYHRTIYYVSGSGGNLPVASGTASGSIFQPFDTIAAAFAEIEAQAALRSEALWQIVVDGNTGAEETSISIDSSVPLSIRRFSAVSGFQISGTQTLTVSGTGSVELKNAVLNANGILNVNAQNLTITNSQLEGLTNIASGSYINVSATDTTSSAAKIKPVDSYNALVLKHIGDTKFTSSFLANYVLEETYSKAGTGAECKRIGPDTATGSATNGDGIIKLYDPNLSIEFDESAYTVVESFTPNPLSQSIAQVTSGTAISLTLTVTQGGSPVASENTSLAVGLYDRAPSQNDSPMTITGEVVNATTNASGIATWSAAFPQYVVQEEGYTGGTYYLKVTYTLNGYNYASIYEVNIVQ